MNTHTHTHTPGPWSDSGHDGKRNVIVESKWGSIAAAWDSGDAMQMKANARLIAPAPDLLAALEDSLEVIRLIGCDMSHFSVARAAISKAKGTS